MMVLVLTLTVSSRHSLSSRLCLHQLLNELVVTVISDGRLVSTVTFATYGVLQTVSIDANAQGCPFIASYLSLMRRRGDMGACAMPESEPHRDI
jgi:hypothetical protein